MPEEIQHLHISEHFDIKEYIDATDDASKRSRWITIVLVVASVIILIGFYNSTKWSWATESVKTAYDDERIPSIVGITDEISPGPALDSFFGEGDFENFDEFACQVWRENDSKQSRQSTTRFLSTYLFSQFSEQSQNLLTKKCAEKKDTNADKEIITKWIEEKFEKDTWEKLRQNIFFDLNIILKDKFLYNEARFSPLANQLQEETRSFLAMAFRHEHSTADLKGKDLIRLNRLLLENAYPQIKKSRDVVPVEGDDGGNILSPLEKRIVVRQNEQLRAFVDNVTYVDIPFFGNLIHVNDLGFFGGLALVIILWLLRHSLSREIKNLNISFREAFYHRQLPLFYNGLAMRQVLTVPHMHGEAKNMKLSVASKYICLLPLGVIFFGFFYDIYSSFQIGLYPWRKVIVLLVSEYIWFIFIFYLSLRCLERKIHIDDIWDAYWEILQSRKIFYVVNQREFTTPDKKLENAVKNHLKKFDQPSESILGIFNRKNLARLIPFDRLAHWIAGDPYQPELIEVINYKLEKLNIPLDGVWSILTRKNLSHLIPIKKIADWLAGNSKPIPPTKYGIRKKTNRLAKKRRLSRKRKRHS